MRRARAHASVLEHGRVAHAFQRPILALPVAKNTVSEIDRGTMFGPNEVHSRGNYRLIEMRAAEVSDYECFVLSRRFWGE